MSGIETRSAFELTDPHPRPARAAATAPDTAARAAFLLRLPASAGPVWALALLAVLANFMVPLDVDYWWHLVDGRYITAHHSLPVPDVFSFTAFGRTWIDHEWLAELLMYRLHEALGVRGPYTLFTLCMVAVLLLTFSTLRRLGVTAGPAFGLCLLMIASMWPFTGARPQVAGFALAALEIWLLERWVIRRDRSVWALP